MKIILKEDALIEHSRSVPEHMGYGQSGINWRKSVREMMDSSLVHEVDTQYLFENSFNVKHPMGHIIGIPDYMVSEVIDDIREKKENKKSKKMKL